MNITLPGTIKLVETQTRQNKMSQIAIFDFPQEQEKWVLIKGKLPLIHFADAQYSRIERARERERAYSTPLYPLNTIKRTIKTLSSPMSTSMDLLLFKLWPIKNVI